jgi:hypothetical protein
LQKKLIAHHKGEARNKLYIIKTQMFFKKYISQLKSENRCKNEVIQLASAILYPQRILIETHDDIGAGVGLVTDKITFVELSVSDSDLGKLIKEHLNKTQKIDFFKIPPDYNRDVKPRLDNYKKVTGLKTIKAQMKDSLEVSIRRINDTFRIIPSINGGSSGPERGYSTIKDEIKECDFSINDEDLGKLIRITWTKCK